jgi:hypothetical protein
MKYQQVAVMSRINSRTVSYDSVQDILVARQKNNNQFF